MTNRDVSTKLVAGPALLIAGMLLIATNLRAPITGVAPVLGMIEAAFDLSPAQAGFLTTLPLLAFAAISPFAALIARDYGLERSLCGALLLIAGGVVVRSLGPVWCLFFGTWIIGSGIAIGNVLLPSLIKRDFPRKVPVVTGTCAVTMGAAAALASAVAFPIAQVPGFGWPIALGAIIVLPAAAIVLWIPQLGGHTAPAKNTATPPHGGRVWHSALAWQVTLYMGTNSILYYVLIGWLPSILFASGFSPAEAGSLHGIMQLASAIPGLLLPPLIARMKDQRLIAVGIAALIAIGLLGFLLVPPWSTLWAVCFGAGSGAGVILSLMFMSLRVSNAQQAAALSGMAQCVGYLLAASGPTIAGMIHDASGGWSVPLWICVALAVAMAVFGGMAGRARHIGTSQSSKTH